VIYTAVAAWAYHRRLSAWYRGDSNHHGSNGFSRITVPAPVPTLDGESVNGNEASFGPSYPRCEARNQTLTFEGGDSTFGLYGSEGTLSDGFVHVRGNSIVSGRAVYATSSVKAWLTLTPSEYGFFCDPFGPYSRARLEIRTGFRYSAEIQTAAGERNDTGTGTLDVAWVNVPDGEWVRMSFASDRARLASVFNYPDFGSVDGLALNGSAAQVGNTVQLTRGTGDQQAGSVWNLTPVWPSESFATSMTLTSASADGFVFVVQRDPAGSAALGRQLGYAGITPSVAVDFDPALYVLSVYENGTLAAVSPSPFYAWPTGPPYGPAFSIDYNASTDQLQIAVGEVGPSVSFSVPIDLASVLGSSAPALVGLTSSSESGDTSPTVINSWELAQPTRNNTSTG
jgi:hypothetical protein